MAESVDIAVIGAGQAGLSISHELSQAGVEHLVLERGRVGQSWRGRWDSFCLVIPNWTVRLPGAPYAGPEPDAFMPRDGIVSHLAAYAESFRAPVREGVAVASLDLVDGVFVLATSTGELRARQVVVASGGYQKPHRPPGLEGLPPSLPVLDAEGYANPGALPPGEVLVIGSGQTGCQIAEELAEAGRGVHLACGRAPWLPRRIEGRDAIGWLTETPFMETPLSALPSPAARLLANPQVSGRDGGHDLNYRTLQALGVNLLGHLAGCEDGRLHFAPDLAESVAFGDARYADIRGLIANACATAGRPVPEMAPPPAFACAPPAWLDASRLSAVICTSGFRPDYRGWIRLDAFDDLGFPLQEDGSSTTVPGLHFMGVHFQRKRKSATLLGVGEDATILAERLTASR